jgi:photosystem II stability/assembly factor-like uncharacterized protein
MAIARSLSTLVLFCALAAAASAQWIKQNVDTKASFRGLSVVNEKVVWASGSGGTIIRTIDGGKTWKVMIVPGAEKLDFRDIEAFDANTAYILSIGNGESSRIYKTVDGGAKWNLLFKNTDSKAFFDAIACMDRNRCLALSDPVEGRFPLIVTTDGGATWRSDTKITGSPIAKEGEAAFAASGTCLIYVPPLTFMLVSGGMAARVFRSAPTDTGYLDWLVSEPSFKKGTSGSGIFSIAMFDKLNGVIVGGDYEKPADANDNLAFTIDGGKTWSIGTGLTGYRSAAAYVDKNTIIAVGTNGTDISSDGGKTWKKIGDENLNVVQAKGNKAVWAAGPNGLVVKLKT